MMNNNGFTGNMFPEKLISKIKKAPVIAVLVIDEAEDAVSVAKALLRGGISAIELTLRTSVALEAMERICVGVPEILVGIGTILSVEQVRAVKERGAAFGVSPGLNAPVVAAAKEMGLPFAPGIMTPSEIEAAYYQGCTVMKLFPSEPIGGLNYLKSINAPYAHLGIRYIPLGGVSQENLGAYLECPDILGIGGSWLAPRKLIQEKNWDQISRNCEKASETVIKARGFHG